MGPTNLQCSSTKACVDLVRNDNYHRNGTKSYLHLMRKWHFNPTLEGVYFQGTFMQQQGKYGPGVGGRLRTVQRLKKKTGPSGEDVGLVGAQDVQNDSLYLAKVAIGSPEQTFMLDFDTGSSDLWLWSTHLPKTVQTQAQGKAIFDPTKSKTYKDTPGATWNISYGDGSSASGTAGTDTVDMGGIKIENQTIELANHLSEEFQEGAGSGLLGLAWSNINTVQPEPVLTPVENMIKQEDIPHDAELFTCKLTNWKENESPFYTFGFLHQQTVDEGGGVDKIWWTDIDNSQGFWQFKSTTATVNGKVTQRANDKDGKPNTSIADTGTTLALIDDASCKAIYAAIPGSKFDQQQQGYIFPSSVTEDQLPIVQIDINGKSFTIQKEDLGFADAGNNFIYGGIQSRGDLPFDILGDTFLKGSYVIFDVGNKRLGLLPRPEQQNPSLPSKEHPHKGHEQTAGEASASDDQSDEKKHGFFHRLLHKNKKVEKHAEL